ncbi:MAG: lytic transglycosylase domain-containing protein [Deltaproteobacteria bacterium]|nr:lytic transglycosylase domain-containing protein [Deltaproteobacteria bacterium]
MRSVLRKVHACQRKNSSDTVWSGRQPAQRRLRVLANAVLLGLLFLIPSDREPDEIRARADLLAQAEAALQHDALQIYTVLKSNAIGLSESSLWDVARTILAESRKHAIDPTLVLAMIEVESSFRHRAVSRRGARGLMQLRPIVAVAFAEEAEVEIKDAKKSLEDPVVNIRLGVFYLGYLKKIFTDLEVALTAYNWGPTRVRKHISSGKELQRSYASRVLSAYRAYRKEGLLLKGSLPNEQQKNSAINL